MTFIIHGATGAQGAPLIKRLTESGHRAVAAGRNVAAVKGYPAVEIDNSSVESLSAAYRGAEGVFFHLPLGPEPDRVQFARNFVQAVALAKPRRVVISTSGSVVDNSSSQSNENAVAVLLDEIERAGVSYAVVAPRLYLENLLMPLLFAPVQDQGVLRYPLKADFLVSWSSHLDVAEVAERLLLDSKVTGVVDVGHSPGLSGPELASGFGEYFGRPVAYEGISPDRFSEMLTPLFGEATAAAIAGGYRAMAQMPGNTVSPSKTAQTRLGLVPRPVSKWLSEVLA